MQRHHRGEIWIVVGILLVASFFRFYQLDPSSLSAIFGILTVLGLYLLARELFDWRVGAVASFLLAISFWHVSFSRVEAREIMLPLVLVYAFYFLWRGLRRSHWWDFFWAGIFGGLGFYIDTTYYIAPLIVILVFINYWLFLKKDYHHENYEHVRNRFLGGFSLFMITAFFVALPFVVYFLKNPSNLIDWATRLVFTPTQSFQIFQNLGWPITILFTIGFLKELYHWLRRKRGHLSPVHTLMFVWFFVMLLPSFFSIETSFAWRAIGVLPVVIIFAARGFLGLFNTLEEWELVTHPWESREHNKFVVPILAAVILLGAIGFFEYSRYFNARPLNQVTAPTIYP